MSIICSKTLTGSWITYLSYVRPEGRELLITFIGISYFFNHYERKCLIHFQVNRNVDTELRIGCEQHVEKQLYRPITFVLLDWQNQICNNIRFTSRQNSRHGYNVYIGQAAAAASGSGSFANGGLTTWKQLSHNTSTSPEVTAVSFWKLAFCFLLIF